MSDDTRLYGRPGDEILYHDFDTAVDYAIDHAAFDFPDVREVVIEEYTVLAPESHLPGADAIVEWMVEWGAEYGEVAEGWDEDIPQDHPDVIAAAEALRKALAAQITFRMADRVVARHRVTFTLDDLGIPSWTYTTATPKVTSGG